MKPVRVATSCLFVLALLFAGFSSSAVLGSTEDPYVAEDVEPAPPKPLAITAPSNAPCAPIVNGLALGLSDDGFAASGLGNHITIPSPLVGKRFNIGNWTCLEDNVSKGVDGAFIEFTDVGGNLVAVWLLLPHAPDIEANDQDWHAYLSSTYESQGIILTYIDSPHSVVGVVQGDAEERVIDIVAAANSGELSTLLLWPELLKATEPYRIQ